MAEQGAAGGVEVGPEVGGAADVALERGRAAVGGVHLAFQGLELGQGQVAGAALDVRAVEQLAGRRVDLGRDLALGRQLRAQDDVGGGVQVALGVAADQLGVLGEGDVALQDAGAHARGGDVGLRRVLREEQRRAAVADREVAGAVAALARGAALQVVLEPARAQPVEQVEGTRAELHRKGAARLAVGSGGGVLSGSLSGPFSSLGLPRLKLRRQERDRAEGGDGEENG